jgi:catechol 2,3-dioxygenase-like lactoylglutathione lyase family enzyme
MNLFMIELTVADLAISLAWYRDRLGLRVQVLDEAGRFALLDSGQVRLALRQGSPAPGTTKVVFETGDLEARLQTLVDKGVHADGPIKQSPEGYRRAFIRDPDGHVIGLFEWTRSAANL